MSDDRDDHRQHAVADVEHEWIGSVLGVQPGDRTDDHDGRNDERRAGGDESARTGSTQPDVHGHLGGVRAGDEIGRADHLHEFLVAQPAATTNGFVAHHGDVGGRTAESDQAEFEHELRDLGDGTVHPVILERRTVSILLRGVNSR